MASLVLEQKKSPNLLLLFALLVVASIAVEYGLHSVAKHNEKAVAVRECVQQGRVLGTWINPENGRKALICQVGDNLFGIMIMKGKFEITSFLKKKLTRIDQIFKYLSNQGYIPE
jgi:hypothetical protein